MAPLNACCSFTAIVVVGILFSGHWISAEECGSDLGPLALQCRQYVGIGGPEAPPSPACCVAIRAAHFPCICKYITPDVEKLISMRKVINIAKKCGRSIAAGTKCGSYIVPPQA